LYVGSGSIGQAFTGFQRCEDALEYVVRDMEITRVTRAEGGWCMKDRGRRRFERECVKELLIGGGGSGSVGHGGYETVVK